jgi:ppGpp synthetase/RelA/SpoT-type nucleotidyltranferase
MPLTREDILRLLGHYEAHLPSFEALAAGLHEELARQAERLSVRHLITHRAKAPASLEGKLNHRASKMSVEEFDGPTHPKLKDLAAARVLLYLDRDVEQVAESLEAAFRERGHPVERASKKEPRGYEAVHLHIGCGGDLLPRGALPAATTVEVQVCTVAAHLWNELEHDIKYKQHGGEPDAAQEVLLRCLLRELRVAMETAAELMSHTDRVIAGNTAPFADKDALHRYLSNREDRHLRGDFGTLFDLLQPLVDPLTPAWMHAALAGGAGPAELEALGATHDPSGGLEDAGRVLMQLSSRLDPRLLQLHAGAMPHPPPPLVRLAARLAAHQMERKGPS